MVPLLVRFVGTAGAWERLIISEGSKIPSGALRASDGVCVNRDGGSGGVLTMECFE